MDQHQRAGERDDRAVLRHHLHLGTVGIILICKYLPRWWGVDAKAAAKKKDDAKPDLPRLEVSGFPASYMVAPDGTVFMASGGMNWCKDTIVRIGTDGALRLIAGGGTSLADGPAARTGRGGGGTGGAEHGRCGDR